MDRYFTVMLVPEREKGVRSVRIPRIIFNSLVFLSVAIVFLIGILVYDYTKILGQVHQNEHLSIENRQLKEQIQLFQMKLNGLTNDIERIHNFEKKLRIITGLEDTDMTKAIQPDDPQNTNEKDGHDHGEAAPPQVKTVDPFIEIKERIRKPSNYEKFNNFKKLYEQKIATNFGLQTGYAYTKEWDQLTKQSFLLANQFAAFDFIYSEIGNFTKELELKVHNLDQFLLDKDSFLKSTPTLLPAKGWITSYYGPRMSHYSNRIKMHEGLDVGAKSGTPIIAPADGIVTFSGKKPGFGNFVQIDHGYGVETIYAHASKLFAKKGQRIGRGDLLAAIGSTGYSTGPHLHYEVRVNGTPVDPLYFILD
ncbi:MAG: M23 family metallopeptidase [Deltaproteobacteria bacterium]|nr:MAG: M23 family metallopeptidase [Deltaproteobacteria bacterium]TNF25631.1 MAG: M23 family metallopeptidase [Deltaproteobacteria bacterium]